MVTRENRLRPRIAELPSYAGSLDSFHRAFPRQLARMVEDLPLRPGDRALDVPCGDGFFTLLLARRVGPTGRAVGADLSEDCLRRARRNARGRAGESARVEWRRADAYHLPFDPDTFDGVWCAQSLISLPEPEPALREMFRVLRPGGFVALMEEDSFHNVILPLPVSLELAVQNGLRRAARRRYGSGSKLYHGRRLSRLLREAGGRRVSKKTYAFDCQAPLPPAVGQFFRDYLTWLRRDVAGYLPAAPRRHLEELTDPDSPRYLLRRPDLEATYLSMVSVARKAGA
ncbi:MAG TPA: methyltransferase domain-containing protein [Gemmataceae bacterium]